MDENFSIKKFYAGREIFITGGSGFVGKSIIEKLLRSCSGVKKVFILLRPKKGVEPRERLEKLLENLVFQIVKGSDPTIFQKLEVIEGDCAELNLGISAQDFEKMKNVSIIFHGAASVRFDDPLKKAILLNTRGTREICKFAETLKNLDCLVHISTAYVNPTRDLMEEKIYDCNFDWRHYIKFAETNGDILLDHLTYKLTDHAPNTYTFTKNLAEQICLSYKEEKNLPILIYRPSIIVCAEVEPIAGWMDSFNGPAAMFLANHSGLKRSLHSYSHSGLDCVPVDICTKGILVAAWKKWKDMNMLKQENSLEIYNCTSIKNSTFQELMDCGKQLKGEIFFKYFIWIPNMVVTPCKYYAYFISIFFQVLPCMMIDSLLYLAKKPTILTKLQRKIMNADVSLSHFIKHTLYFDKRNFESLKGELLECDKNEFFMDERMHSVLEFIRMSSVHVFKYWFNQTEEETRSAEKRYRIMKVIDDICRTIFYCLLAYYFYYLLMSYF